MKQPRLGERLSDFPKVPRQETGIGATVDRSGATVDSWSLDPSYLASSKAFSTVLDTVVAEREISNEEDKLGAAGRDR